MSPVVYENIILFFTIVISVFGLFFVSKSLVPVWMNRNIDFYALKDEWQNILYVSAFAGITVAASLFLQRNSPVDASSDMFFSQPIPYFVIVCMGFFASFAALYGITDGKVFSAPQEISWLAMLFGLPLAILFAPDGGLISAAIWCIVPILLYLTPTGLADVRFLWVVSFVLSWWTGWFTCMLLLAASAILQLVFAAFKKFTGWGHIVHIRPSPLVLSFKRLWKKMVPSSKVDLSTDKKPHLATPWLPSLAITYVFGLGYLVVTGNNLLLINGGVGLFFI